MTGKKRNPKNRRKNIKNPALVKRYNSRIRQEYIDMDYLDELSEEELAWMNDFMKEYNNASVRGGDRLDENRFHNTEELKKDCTDRNNARNRDIYSIAKAQNRVINGDYYDLTDLIDEIGTQHITNPEDIIIELLDQTEELANSGSDSDDSSDDS